MFDYNFDEFFWNEYDEDNESYWDNATNENFNKNKYNKIMVLVVCAKKAT